MKRGPYEITKSTVVYKNPWITVREDAVIKPDGTQGIFGIVDYLTGITVIPLNKEKEVYLIDEYHYAIDDYGIQLPSGGADEGEDPLTAAKRELEEETGLIAEKWHALGMVHPLTTMLKGPAHLYLAFNVQQKGKPEEGIRISKVPFDQAYQMALHSEILHAQSCVAILRAKDFLQQQGML